MMYPIREGSILQFTNPLDGIVYDGVVWRVVSEDETNFSVFIRFVDEV